MRKCMKTLSALLLAVAMFATPITGSVFADEPETTEVPEGGTTVAPVTNHTFEPAAMDENHPVIRLNGNTEGGFALLGYDIGYTKKIKNDKNQYCGFFTYRTKDVTKFEEDNDIFPDGEATAITDENLAKVTPDSNYRYLTLTFKGTLRGAKLVPVSYYGEGVAGQANPWKGELTIYEHHLFFNPEAETNLDDLNAAGIVLVGYKDASVEEIYKQLSSEGDKTKTIVVDLKKSMIKYVTNIGAGLRVEGYAADNLDPSDEADAALIAKIKDSAVSDYDLGLYYLQTYYEKQVPYVQKYWTAGFHLHVENFKLNAEYGGGVRFEDGYLSTNMLMDGAEIDEDGEIPNNDIEINEENFPDDNFRKYISSEFDLDDNGYLDRKEIGQVTFIDIDDKNIYSIEGVQFFPKLYQLSADDNYLNNVDLSENKQLMYLSIHNNDLGSFDLRNLTNLENVDLSNNKLKKVLFGEVTPKSINLRNNQIDSIDLRITAFEMALYNNSLSYENITANNKSYKRVIAKSAGIRHYLEVDNNVNFIYSSLTEGKPIRLNGDRTGAASAEGTWTSRSDAYLYMGFVSFEVDENNEPDASYRYLILKHTGSLENMRLQFVSFDDRGGVCIDDKYYWFNSKHEFTEDELEGNTIHFLRDVSGKELKVSNLQGGTLIIDLAASGVDLLSFHQGMHMHIDGLRTTGGVTISEAWLSKTPYDFMAPSQPKLVATYNGAQGIGVKFEKSKGATSYKIWRKYNGKWSVIKTVSANDKSLQKSGNTLMYTDTSVKTKYGQGYIYSVSAVNSIGASKYNTLGLAAYRLVNPNISKVVANGSGKATVTWTKVACQGYEVQYATEANAKKDKWTKAKEVKYGKTSQTISGLKKGQKYVFRIRCEKTNKDRGTTWSQYSAWKTVVAK